MGKYVLFATRQSNCMINSHKTMNLVVKDIIIFSFLEVFVIKNHEK